MYDEHHHIIFIISIIFVVIIMTITITATTCTSPSLLTPQKRVHNTRKTYFVIFHFKFTFDIRAFACFFQGRNCKIAIHFWFLLWPIACNHRLVNTNETVKTLNKLFRLVEMFFTVQNTTTL